MYQNPSNQVLNKAKYVVLDLETTGLNCYMTASLSLGLSKWKCIVSILDMLINPNRKLTKKISDITILPIR